MLLVLGFIVVVLAASATTGLAQTRESGSMDKAATSHIAEIAEYLKKPRNAGRDGHLYSLAVLLFEAIDFGKVKDIEGARTVMAQALREASLGGIPEAHVDYGRCLWNGWGVKPDQEAALAEYKKAAALGSDFGAYLAAFNLYWTFKRYDEAYALARQAAKGEPKGETLYLLGLMAFNGRGRPKDVAESLRLHQQAAELGNADALFELFTYAMNGIGDRTKAIVYLQDAAKREQPRAMANLGALHATGEHGIAKDLALSVTWYRRAADKGNGRAAAVLGLMALRGEGMVQDAEHAKAFFARADELGFDVDGYLKGIGFARP
jgi:TPR repeat protein